MALLKKSPKDLRDFKYSEIQEDAEIPLYIDLRDSFGVMNQGTTSKCVAYACAALKYYQEKINNKRNIEFAPDFIYERKELAGDGMHLRNACKILKEIGCCRRSVYESSVELSTRLRDAENWKIDSYAAVSSIEDCKRAIALQGPVLIMTKCYNNGPMFWKDDGKNKNANYHATLLVGYGSNGFILQNSWGSGWGKRGYTNFPFSDFGEIAEAWTMVDMDKVVMPDAYVDIINNPGMTTTQKKCCAIC
jgi:hypothetical protein